MSYVFGSEIRLTATFQNADAVPTDPGGVTVMVRSPQGITTYTYINTPDIQRDSAGVYHLDVVLNAPGVWYYRWSGTGAVVAAYEGDITVSQSLFPTA